MKVAGSFMPQRGQQLAQGLAIVVGVQMQQDSARGDYEGSSRLTTGKTRSKRVGFTTGTGASLPLLI